MKIGIMKIRIITGLGALALGFALMFGIGTSPASAQPWSASGNGTGNVLPFSWGPNSAPAITPWNNPQNIGSRMNGLYNSTVLPPSPLGQPLYHYAPSKQTGKHGKRKAR
jgi:hypothetical protein